MWGSNVPVTRTPDAHFMTEARYRGQKVVDGLARTTPTTPSSPTSGWPPHPGTDGALAMAMGHVILKEFFVDRQVPRFVDYVKQYTDLPFLVTLREHGTAPTCRTSSSPRPTSATSRRGAPTFKTVLLDAATGRPHVPNGSLGFRFTESGVGRWNLDLDGVDPALSLHGADGAETVAVDLPRFDLGQADGEGGGSHPPRRAGRARSAGALVTTVFDLLLAQYGVGRDGLPGRLADRLRRRRSRTRPPGRRRSPACRPRTAERIGREFAANAEDSGGRSMIIMGAGHQPLVPLRHDLPRVPRAATLTGCQGVNGGGWAHYVGPGEVPPGHRLGAAGVRRSTGRARRGR